MGNDTILEVKGLHKFFDITHANRDIDFSLKRGEIRGLAGENGSGKSTFASIIAGIQQKSSGEMYLNGEPYSPSSPFDARKCKIGMVVQEMGLVSHLPLSVNIFLGDMEQFSTMGIISNQKMMDAAKEQMEKWNIKGLPLNSNAMVNSVETRKLVEVLRALSIDPDILILDEVTQALSQDKRAELYEIINRCQEMGKAVLVISHDLEELYRITQSITIFRDGKNVATRKRDETTVDELKQLLVGRKLIGTYYRSDNAPDYGSEVLLEVKGLSTKDDSVQDISFELHEGEILVLCGLSDSGIHETGQAVFGIKKKTCGEAIIKQKNVEITSAVSALKNGVAYLPKDRDGEALMVDAPIKENFVMPSLTDIENKVGYLDEKKLDALSNTAIESFDVKCVNSKQIIGDLSGGNKQKINLGRWTIKGSDIFIFDCPTRGVDVGVKAYIYQLLRELKANGKAILMISDELQEAMGMADRILVMKKGRQAAIIPRGDRFTEEELIGVML